MTNTYSRLGGAYLVSLKSKKTSHSSVAIFPIYTTLRYIKNGDPKTYRLCSRIMLTMKLPRHARNVTDRINTLYIEMFPNTPTVRTYLSFQR